MKEGLAPKVTKVYHSIPSGAVIFKLLTLELIKQKMTKCGIYTKYFTLPKPTHRDLNAAKLLLSSKIDSSKMPSDTELNRLLISLSDKDYISFNPTREIFYPLKSIIKLIKHLKIQQTLTKQESKKKTEANFLSLADYYRALPQVQKEKVKINIAGLKQFFNVYIQSQYPGVNLLEAGYKNNNDLFQRDFLKKFFDNCLLFFSGEN